MPPPPKPPATDSKCWIFIPADLEQAKILGTQVFGAKLVRISGSYDQVNRLCSQIADEHNWGFVNVNLRPYYAEGSKTFGYEIAEQLGWRLPDNVVCPHGRRIAHHQNKKGFRGTDSARPGRTQAGEIFRRAGDRMLADLDRGKARQHRDRTAEALRHRAVARNRQSGGRTLRHTRPSLEAAAGQKTFPIPRSSNRFSFSPRPKASSPKLPAE